MARDGVPMTVDDYDKFVLIEYEVGPDGERGVRGCSEDTGKGIVGGGRDECASKPPGASGLAQVNS